jgi:hypothetical protein
MERVALALDGEFTPEIERHMAMCAECRELLADRELLRAAPEIAPESYAAVRERVLARVSRPNAVWWRAAAAVVLAAAGLTWWLLRMPEAERLEIAVASPAAPVVERPRARAELRAAPGTVRRRVERTDAVSLAMRLRAELDPAPPRMMGDVAVAMQTEDPEVFILLVGGADDE